MEERAVADLPGARMPADHGLSSLGLLMQLAGSAFLGLMGLLVVLLLFGGGAFRMWPVLLLCLIGAIRSGLHRGAGSALLYGSPNGPFRSIKLYIGCSVTQAALGMLLMGKVSEVGAAGVAWVGLILLAWPVALGAVILSPRLRRLASEVPMPEDLGYEGASVLMSMFGAIGIGFAAMLMIVFGKMLTVAGSIEGIMMMGVTAVLLVRSALQLKAGLRGTRGISADAITEATGRYTSFGVLSSIGASAVLLVMLMISQPGIVDLLVIGLLLYLLLIWPTTLRRFFTERNFSVMLAGDEGPVLHRAPDAGLTALGWLLLASSVIGLALALPQALLGIGASDLLGSFARGLGDTGTEGSWLDLIAPALQLWAAIELIRMTDRYKLAATIYGAVAAAVTVYLVWPTIRSMIAVSGLGDLFGPGSLVAGGTIALSLVVPVGTILLVNRAQTAVARVHRA